MNEATSTAAPPPPADAPAARPGARREPGAAEPVVRIRGISKRFPVRRRVVDTLLRPHRREWQTALETVDLEVGSGEFFGLLGQNGAGKTTLFKILATLILPDEGTATIGGHDLVREAAAVKGWIAPVIPNERSLYWRLSAGENLNLYARLYGLEGRTAADRVAEVLDRVGLAGTGGKLVGLFSSGMRQRLLLARALLARPRVLLLDEPTRSLDPVTAREFRAFLRTELGGRQGCTVLLATHDHEEVVDLCDRIGILERGRLLAVGPTDRLLGGLTRDRYRLLTREPLHPALAELPEGAVELDAGSTARDGWRSLQVHLPGGNEAAAGLVARLAAAGVTIARFERVEVRLAELIQSVVARDGAAEDREYAGGEGGA